MRTRRRICAGRRLVVWTAKKERTLQRELIRRMRAAGLSHFQIAKSLGLTLSEVRRALDPKAQEAHKRWAA